jgi:hypothetical protein
LKSNVLFVLVPDLPPNINGLGHYAYILSNQLILDNPSIKIEFIVASNPNYQFKEINGFKVHVLHRQISESLYQLLERVNSRLIHLHYVGYGYAKRGVPFWLYFGLLKWRQKDGNLLFTTFHELYANSKVPWSSSFWNQLFQKYICKKIYLISKSVVTSRDSFKKVLLDFDPFINISVLPVFSNFGEMNNFHNIESKEKGLIVLGSKETRFNVYKKFQKELNIICQNCAINTIIDVGPKFDKLPELNVPIIELGILESNQISNLLKKNSFGIIAGHSSDFFAKSGIFAAYAAHGNIVFALNVNLSKIEDGIIVNHHFVTINSVNINYNLISKTVYEWYNNHTLKKQSDVYSNIFNL